MFVITVGKRCFVNYNQFAACNGTNRDYSLLLIQLAIAVYPFIAKDISVVQYTTQYENLNWVWNWSGNASDTSTGTSFGNIRGICRLSKDNDVESI